VDLERLRAAHRARELMFKIILTKQVVFKILPIAFLELLQMRDAVPGTMDTEPLYDPATIQLDTSLGYYLAKARNVLIARTDQALKSLDLTSQQIGVMLMLASGRARTPQELSREMSYDSGSMTRMLDRLEKKGFLARSRSEADRRIVELSLTERGREAAVQLPQIGAAVLNEQLQGFSRAELDLLTGMLVRIIANSPLDECGACGEDDDE
jgi:DNA-binding MarR family transcriptional regulator